MLSEVHQAVIHHMTLILTFDHIKSERGELPAIRWPVQRSGQRVRRSRIRVTTFSELDRSNGVPVKNRIDVAVGQPSQVTVAASG